MSGFIRMERASKDHPVIGKPDRFYAWFWLVSSACWKNTPYDIGGKIVTLVRGQVCVSRAQLAAAWDWSPSAVERFLSRLETEQMIGRATGQGRSIINIRNYAKYPDKREQTGQPTGQASGQRPDSDRTAKEQGNKVSLSNDNGAEFSDQQFWANARAYLGASRGSLIGKWCRDYGQAATARAITEAQLNRAADPIPYIERTLRRGKSDAEALPIC